LEKEMIVMATRKSRRPVASEPVEPREPVEGGYRCVECGHGKKLWAYAGCNAYGPLAADGGSLDEYEGIEEWGIHEDSIQCAEHPGARLESFVGGRWCRWWTCPECHGGGRVRYGGQYDREYSVECRKETPFPHRPFRAMGRDGVHEGWLPADEFAALESAASA
jgi:hypothetical protein